jgi:heme exporter protein A
LSARLGFDAVACARGGQVLFEDLGFSLGPGDAAAVTGPNGVGKSSLLRIAAGLLRPTAGSARREGSVALLTEAHALDPELALGAALGFWAGMDGVAPALGELALAHLAAVPVRLLSTGQRRRAALARVVAGGADIWLLDEPLNGLDVEGVALLERLVAKHRTRGGIAVVASHQALMLPDALAIEL